MVISRQRAPLRLGDHPGVPVEEGAVAQTVLVETLDRRIEMGGDAIRKLQRLAWAAHLRHHHRAHDAVAYERRTGPAPVGLGKRSSAAGTPGTESIVGHSAGVGSLG